MVTEIIVAPFVLVLLYWVGRWRGKMLSTVRHRHTWGAWGESYMRELYLWR